MQLLITDLTYMRGGLCIAGINPETLENIRPVLSFGQIQEDFIHKRKIYPGALVEFNFIGKKSNPPHIEDYVFNPESTRFIKFVSQSKWQDVLNSCAAPSLASAFNNLIVDNKGVLPGAKTPSLVVIKVDGIKVNFFDSDPGAILPFKIRVSFSSEDNLYHLPVTDKQFIDYCNDKFKAGFSRDELKDDLQEFINSSKYIYLRIGLTRPFKKAEDAKELCYLQVNGIYSDNLDNEIRYIALNETKEVVPVVQKHKASNMLQFRLFNIPLTNGDSEMELLNTFLHDIEIKRFNASVVDNKFWSILLGYVPVRRNETAKSEKLSCESMSELTSEDLEIYERLRKWRNDKAQMQNVPEYFIFSNKTLMAIAKFRPMTLDALLNISGVGERKISEYGDEVLKIISPNEK